MLRRQLSPLDKCNKVVIIGSSPLLLMAALSFARRGKNVIVVSEQKSWGGSWRYSKHMGAPIDTSCHLLESYKVAHRILRQYKVNLTVCRGPCAPIRLTQNSLGNTLRVEQYHSRERIAREAYSKVMTLCKRLILFIVEPDKQTKLSSLAQSFFDILLFVRYRLPQVLFLEPICRPAAGWPSLIIDLTYQLQKNNITVIDDRAIRVSEGLDYSSVVIRSGPPIRADLVVSGQSTLLTSSSSELDSKFLGKTCSIKPSLYVHFLVEVNLPGFLNFPFYIHLPDNDELHRITFSHASSSSCFYLVQVRRNEIQIETLLHSIKSTFSDIIKSLFDEPVLITGTTEDYLKVTVHERFTPAALQPSDAINVRPALFGRHLVLRTYGDLARNIAQHAQLLT